MSEPGLGQQAVPFVTADQMREVYAEWARVHAIPGYRGTARIVASLDGPSFLYFASADGMPIKIGASTNPCRRVTEFTKGYRLRLVVPGFRFVAEHSLHTSLKPFRATSAREWYRPDSPVADLMARLLAVSAASFIERVGPKPRQEAPRHCSVCHRVGHNSRTCRKRAA